jgi:hypothetical protein
VRGDTTRLSQLATISVVIAVIAVILHYGRIAIPHVTQSNFVTLRIGCLVLLAGNLFKGV